MATVYVRHVSDAHKESLAMLAKVLNMSLNQLMLLIIADASEPFSPMRDAILDRAERLDAERQRSRRERMDKLILESESGPMPSAKTRSAPLQDETFNFDKYDQSYGVPHGAPRTQQRKEKR